MRSSPIRWWSSPAASRRAIATCAPLVGLAVCLAGIGSAGAQPEPPPAAPAARPAVAEPVRVALQGAGHRLLRLASAEPVVDFPIDGTPAAPDLDVTVLEATFGSPPASADGIFTARALVDDGGARVRIGADVTQLRTGPYTVRLRVTGPGIEPFEPTVQVSVPAPELRVPERLSVQRIRPLFPALVGDGQASAEPLVVREVGRFAGLSAVTVTQIGPLRLDGRAEVGRIHTPAAVPDLAPGGTATIDYAVEPRHLPPGTVEGAIELSARELGEPVRIPVEIVTRVDPVWIIFLVLVGVFLGYVSRQLLGRWRARNDALAIAAVERRATLALSDAAADRRFQQALEAIVEALDQAVGTRDPQAIAAAAARARTDREAARTALEATYDGLAARFGGVVARLTGRRLPPRIVARLDGRLPPIHDALMARQTDRADGLLTELTQKAELEGLRAVWSDWQLDASQAVGTLDRLGDLVESVPAVDAAALSPTPTDADFDGLFAHGGAAFEAVHQLTAEVWVLLDGAIEEVLVGLGGAIEPGRSAAIRDLLGQARVSLSSGSPIDALRLMTGELLTALAAAIAAARPGPATRDLLARRQYRAAATPARAPTRGVIEESDLVGGPDAVLSAPEVGRARPAAEPPAPPPGWQTELAVARLGLAAPPTPPAFTPPKPLLAEAIGSLVNAVVIALVAYVVYEDSFVGDGPQLISTLLWAYGMDLGAEAVKAQLQRVSPGGAG